MNAIVSNLVLILGVPMSEKMPPLLLKYGTCTKIPTSQMGNYSNASLLLVSKIGLVWWGFFFVVVLELI